jgi:hypothetical protein
MRISLISIFKPIALSITAIAVLSLAHGIAQADPVSFEGFTTGCFGAACSPPTMNAPQANTLLGLTYNNSTFSGTTSSGFLAIGNNAGTTNVNNLGSITLNGTPADYNGQSFTLRVTFTLPPGITGGNSRTFETALMGNVSSNGVGGVLVFDSTPSTFIFSFVNQQGQTVTGSFNFSVNDVSLIAGGTIAVSGTITEAQQGAMPEPATMVLLGTGLFGVAAVVRRQVRARSKS